MKTPRANFAAAAIPLLLASLPLSAAELPFNAPSTARAQESAQLLHQAARALGDQAATSARDRHISNLWIFPTAEADTVFAQYQVSSNKEGVAPTEHLSVLKVRGDRILEQTDLTDAREYSVADQGSRPTATPHWSASIGTGHASSNNEATSSAHGVPATPHWTAQIGTGAAASSAAGSKRPSSPNRQSAFADAHWTSKIGTGHATDSNGREGT